MSGARVGRSRVFGNEQEAEGALIHCSLCHGLFEPANWRQCVCARVVFCETCRRERTKDVNRIKNAARGPIKKWQMTGRTDLAHRSPHRRSNGLGSDSL